VVAPIIAESVCFGNRPKRSVLAQFEREVSQTRACGFAKNARLCPPRLGRLAQSPSTSLRRGSSLGKKRWFKDDSQTAPLPSGHRECWIMECLVKVVSTLDNICAALNRGVRQDPCERFGPLRNSFRSSGNSYLRIFRSFHKMRAL
jgi:hypothetical protein